MKPILFKGSGVALVTPMNEDESINFNELEKLIEFQIKNKTDAIIVCGTTGENATLSDSEKEQVIKFTVEKVNGKIPVIAGTGGNCTKRSVHLSKLAEKLRCDGILVVTPYYNKTSQEGLYYHYKTIAQSVKIPVILYNVPSRTGIDIALETCLKLSKIDNILAIKEASGDISKVSKIISFCGENLNVYSGNDDQTLPVLSLGGIGVISVFANIFPKEMHNINSLYFEGKVIESRNLFFKYLNTMNALFCDVNPVPVKESLNMMGFNCGKCRMPLFRLNSENIAKLKSALRENLIES